jgi:hypothetical protein
VQGKVQLHQGASKLQAGSRQMLSEASSAVQSAAQSAALSAGRLAQQGAQQASSSIGSQLRDGAFTVRRWAASQLEDAADYTTSTMTPAVSKTLVKTVAPAVSGTLRSTARQVSPPRRRSSWSSARSMLGWTALAAAVAAAVGAAGTLVWRRYRTAMAADTEADVIVYAADDPRDITLDGTSGADRTGAPSSGPGSSEETSDPRSSSAW